MMTSSSNLKTEPAVLAAPQRPSATSAKPANRIWAFVLFAGILALLFTRPLSDLARLAGRSAFYSHIFLVPFISFYLVWLSRKNLPQFRTSTGLALAPGLIGFTGLLSYWILRRQGWAPGMDDQLSLLIFSLLAFFISGCFLFFGGKVVRALVFPLAFLIFIVPMPRLLVHGIEVFFQHTSAFAALAFIEASGTPFLRDGLVFRLPGITLAVAEECSGIRSSLVLFITSLLAGHLFLISPWKKSILALAVIPLGIIRNGFRIFTIAMLCSHIGPHMISSPFHHRGGPLFFLLSLIPFFLLLLWLRKSDLKPITPSKQATVPRENSRS